MKRIWLYVIGIFILTLGISLTIKSNLGTMPFDSLNVGLTELLGLTVGIWEIINGVILVIINALLLRTKPDIPALWTAFITGVGIDFWLLLVLEPIEVSSSLLESFFLVSGIVLLAAGVALYLKARFAYNPVDGFMVAIQQLSGLSLGASKTIVSLILLIISYFIGGPIGIGTFIAVVLIGPAINFFDRQLTSRGFSGGTL